MNNMNHLLAAVNRTMQKLEQANEQLDTFYVLSKKTHAQLEKGMLRKSNSEGIVVKKITREMLENESKIANKILKWAEQGRIGGGGKDGFYFHETIVRNLEQHPQKITIKNSETPGEVIEATVLAIDNYEAVKEAFLSLSQALQALLQTGPTAPAETTRMEAPPKPASPRAIKQSSTPQVSNPKQKSDLKRQEAARVAEDYVTEAIRQDERNREKKEIKRQREEKDFRHELRKEEDLEFRKGQEEVKKTREHWEYI